jgi:anthranilate phosphoribosyltransferase
MNSTITQIVVHGDDEDALNGNDTTTIELVDEGSGRFITLTQFDSEYNEVVTRLDPKEIPLIMAQIKVLLGQE